MRYQPTIDDVGCSHGSPMGRNAWLGEPTERCHLFRLEFVDGCYDRGGAYWGSPANVWCCTDAENFRWFVRAPDRKTAFELVKKEFPEYDIKLKRGLY